MLPIDTESKEWIDAKCSWIVDQFGIERILNSKIMAADAELLDGYRAADYDSVLALFRKICMTMDIEFDSIHFYIMSNDNQIGLQYAAGLYQSLGNGMHAITIDQSLLERPVDLIATLAHELCHVLLIGQNRITGEEDDHEPLTDLLTVFFGFGALSGNSVLRDESWHEGNTSGWRMQRAELFDDAHVWVCTRSLRIASQRSPGSMEVSIEIGRAKRIPEIHELLPATRAAGSV